MVRIGLVGCGGIGKHHAVRLRELPNAKITAVCDILPDRLQKATERYEALPFENYIDMVDEVDAVWVCTPPDTHANIAVDFLKQGKHVFCEKPMALSLDDCDRMMMAAKTSGRLLAIGYCLRFWDWTRKCREVVESGRLGDLISVWVTRMEGFPGTDWLPFEARSGGMLTEQTTHNLDWMRMMAGDVESIFAKGVTVKPGADILDNMAVVVTFQSGVIGQVMASWSSSTSWIESGIVGTKGVLRTGQGGEIKLNISGCEQEVITPDDNDMYADEGRVFIECIEESKPYLFDVAEAKKSLAVSLGAQQSARTGQVISLE